MKDPQGEVDKALTVSARMAWVLAVFLSVAVGIIVWRDVASASGLAFPVLYIAAVLVATFGQRPWLVWWVAAASTVATMAAYVAQADRVEWWLVDISLINRLVTVAIMVLTALSCTVLLRRRHDLRRASRALSATEVRLEEQNRLLRIANDLAKIGGWSFDFTDEPVVAASDEVSRIFGWDPGQPVDTDQAFEAFIDQDAREVSRVFEECVQNAVPFTYEGRIRVDDQVRWVRLMGEPVVDRHGTVVRVQGAFQDITAIKEIERMEGRFTHLADSLSVIVWTADSGGDVTYYNKAVEKYTGISRTELLGRRFGRVIHPDDTARARETWNRAVSTGRDLDVEYRIRSSSGEYRWFHLRATPELDSSGAVAQWWGNSIDIHEHIVLKAKAQALAVDRDDILQSIGDAVYSLDREWRFTYLNRNAETVLHRSARDLTGQVVWDAFPDLRDSAMHDAYQAAMTERTAQRITEYYAPLEKWFDVTATPSPQGLTVYFRDVTEFRSLTEQLAQAQRIDALDRLTLGKREPLKPVPVDLVEMFDSFIPQMNSFLGTLVSLDVRVEPGLPRAFVDPSQLTSAMMSLADNAREAMSTGGTIRIEVDNVEVEEDVPHAHGTLTAGRYLTITMTDTGPGIEPELAARLFDPFTTTKPASEGAGLGLPMVWGFVTQSDGHITVTTEVGHGTTVTLYLPRA